MVRLIDTRQNKVSARQYQVTISQTWSKSILGQLSFFKWTADHRLKQGSVRQE